MESPYKNKLLHDNSQNTHHTAFLSLCMLSWAQHQFPSKKSPVGFPQYIYYNIYIYIYNIFFFRKKRWQLRETPVAHNRHVSEGSAFKAVIASISSPKKNKKKTRPFGTDNPYHAQREYKHRLVLTSYFQW